MNELKTKGKIFYGWYIVAAECVMCAMIMGIIYNCQGLFVVPVCEDMNFPRQAMSMQMTILSMCGMALSFMAGKIFTRRLTMPLVRFCSIATPVLFGCYSLVVQEWMLYPIAVGIGLCYGIVASLSLPVVISNWFDEKRGLALGIAFMGSGIGGMIFNGVTGALLTAVGWRMTYVVLAVMMLVVSVPCAFFVLRFCPEDMGLHPYGYKEKDAPTEGTEPAQEGMLLKEALRTPRFLGVCLMMLVMGFCSTQLSQTTSPRMLDTGYGNALAATVISVCMAVLALSKVLEGRMFDSRLGARGTSVFAAIMALVHVVGLLFSKNQMMIPLIVSGFGLGCAFGSVGPSNVAITFGRRDYPAILGVLNALTSLGGMLGPVFAAAVFDNLGSYDIAYYVVIAGCVIHAVLAAVAVRSVKKPEKA
ncbi:MAG: MFS transporter [Clostridia bacterium]|nr:MFS transporter [Clostridia bacterium]